jgi:hypothetical protein
MVAPVVTHVAVNDAVYATYAQAWLDLHHVQISLNHA